MRLSLIVGTLFSSLFLSLSTFSQTDFDMLFQIKKPVIAAVMLAGEYETNTGKEEALKKAMKQLEIARAEGVDSILYEFRGGDIMTPPISDSNYRGMVEIMKAVIAQAKPIVIGVEILWHFPHETIRLARDSGASFVRLDFFSDEMIADGARVPVDPKELMEYRELIGAQHVLMLTDIQVKYAEMVDPSITMTQSARRAESFGTDAVVVSGKASGNSPGGARVLAARQGVTKAKVVIGSGCDEVNAPELLRHANAVIVGTSISTQTGGDLVPQKVRRFMQVIRRIREQD